MSFVERHGLWSDVQAAAAAEVERTIRDERLEVVRFAFADQHGLVRGKTLVAAEALAVLRSGIGLVGTNLLKDTSDRTAWPVFTSGAGMGSSDFQGASDVLIVPDPGTFRILPWTTKTGWLQCDAYFHDGRPVPYDTRAVYRRALAELAAEGFGYMVGLEVEFHVYRVVDPRLAPADAGWPGEPPQVALLNTGYRLLAEQRYDQLEPVVELLRGHLQSLGLPLRSMEIELGPSQIEFVFGPTVGMTPADSMILFRSAAKQIARRHGYHVTFMCRPRLPQVMSSGWHLHQSLVALDSGRNVFVPEAADGPPNSAAAWLSPVGQRFMAGLLAHARGAAAFAAPTINGYRRFRPNSLAPDRATWGRDNRGAMLRLIGGPGDGATRLENRIGEPAANPYLYLASQIHAGLDGVRRGLDPGPSADTPYEAKAPLLPRSLGDALLALREDEVLRRGFGDAFIDYFIRIKEAEISRFEAEVTDWEHREYFDLF